MRGSVAAASSAPGSRGSLLSRIEPPGGPELVERLADLELAVLQSVDELRRLFVLRGTAAKSLPHPCRGGDRFGGLDGDAAHRHIEEQQDAGEEDQPVPDRLQVLELWQPGTEDFAGQLGSRASATESPADAALASVSSDMVFPPVMARSFSSRAVLLSLSANSGEYGMVTPARTLSTSASLPSLTRRATALMK